MWITLDNGRRALNLDACILVSANDNANGKATIDLKQRDGCFDSIPYSSREGRDSDFKIIVDKLTASNGTQNGTP